MCDVSQIINCRVLCENEVCVSQREIDKEILERAAECKKEYRCLSCAPDELCKIEYSCGDGGTHFVECAEEKSCNFLESYRDGKTVVCNCPVRKAIYSSYGV